MRLELVIACNLVLTLCPAGQTMADPLPWFDCHIFSNLDAPERYSPKEAVRILDEAGVTRACFAFAPTVR